MHVNHHLRASGGQGHAATRLRLMEKWERRATARDSKRRKRQSRDMVVRGRSLKSTIVPAIMRRGEQAKKERP